MKSMEQIHRIKELQLQQKGPYQIAKELAIQGMANKEAKSFLRTNGIPERKLEEVLAALMELESGSASSNVSFYLERAKQQRQNVIVWIV